MDEIIGKMMRQIEIRVSQELDQNKTKSNQFNESTFHRSKTYIDQQKSQIKMQLIKMQIKKLKQQDEMFVPLGIMKQKKEFQQQQFQMNLQKSNSLAQLQKQQNSPKRISMLPQIKSNKKKKTVSIIESPSPQRKKSQRLSTQKSIQSDQQEDQFENQQPILLIQDEDQNKSQEKEEQEEEIFNQNIELSEIQLAPEQSFDQQQRNFLERKLEIKQIYTMQIHYTKSPYIITELPKKKKRSISDNKSRILIVRNDQIPRVSNLIHTQNSSIYN